MSGADKTILYLCKCSSHVSNFIDFDPIIQWAKDSHKINIVAISNLLCAPQGKQFFQDVISNVSQDQVKSIVVAACSPKLHEKTFQDLAEEKGINMSKVTMANIREQCAWVTKDKQQATQKAKSLINAALKRSFYAENLDKHKMKVETDIIIIGGGIAGMIAALTFSKADRKVFLVEKDISIGGSVIKTEDVAPAMECSPCMLAPLLSRIRDDDNIEVITNSEITEILGFFGNFSMKVKKRARYVKDNCISCEECYKVCPVEKDSDFHEGLGKRKAVYSLFPGSVPQSAVIDKSICLHFKGEPCDKCVGVCPFQSIDFQEQDKEIVLKSGAIVLATGFKNADVSSINELAYGRLENVFTTPEFERMASSNGPTGGKVTLKNGDTPSSVSVIHCAGSLREDHLSYCSGVCCLNALKVGEFARKANPAVKVFNIHNDLVLTGPLQHEFLDEQKRHGTEFIRCNNLTSLNLSLSQNNKITIQGDGITPLETDMVVLSTGMLPCASTLELSGMLNLDLDEHGFFQKDHELLHSTLSALDGVYIAGCTRGPVDVSGSVIQARAVAGDALSKLIPGREIDLEVMTSYIQENICAGCKLCIAACPYHAISYNKEKSISMINEAICRGCGTCVAACPSSAAIAKNFTDEQIYAEIGGLINV